MDHINHGSSCYPYLIQKGTCNSGLGFFLIFASVFYILKPWFCVSFSSVPLFKPHCSHSLFSPSRTTLLETSDHSHCSPPETFQGVLLFLQVGCSAIQLLAYCQCCIELCHVSCRLNSCHITFCQIGMFIDSSFMTRL